MKPRPLLLLLARSVIQDHLLRRWRACEGVSALERRSRYVVTVLWITVTLLFATFVPDISQIISVIGGISAFFIFIFPGVCLHLSPKSASAAAPPAAAPTLCCISTGLCLMFAMQSEPVTWRTR